jgi:hypothetical protein
MSKNYNDWGFCPDIENPDELALETALRLKINKNDDIFKGWNLPPPNQTKNPQEDWELFDLEPDF